MKKFAVFGNPIAHSISPLLHNLAIKELSLDAFYGRVFLENGEFLKKRFEELGLSGANITLPFKEIAFGVCDEIDEFAKSIGSLNTLVKKDSKIYGYNTDAPGFLKAISEFKFINSALIIGAGGTTKAMFKALEKAGIKTDIVNRSKKDDFKNFYTWENFTPQKYDIVINATSAGLNDNALPADKIRLAEIFKSSRYAFDAIYGKETSFLKLAKSMGLVTKSGEDMLLFQAVLALNLFFDNKLDENKIEASMRKALSLSKLKPL